MVRCVHKSSSVKVSSTSSSKGTSRNPSPWHVWPRTPHKHIFKVQRASTCQPILLQETCGLKDHLQGFQVFIKLQVTHITFIIPSRVQGPSPTQKGPHHAFLQVIGVQGHRDHDKRASWTSSTTSTTQGDLQGSSFIMTSPVGLPNLLLGYQDPIKAWMTHNESLMLLQPIKGLSILYKGFNTISKVFSIISRVFSIVNTSRDLHTWATSSIQQPIKRPKQVQA